MDALTGYILAACLLWAGLGAFVARVAVIQAGLERRLRLLERESQAWNEPGRDAHE